MNITHYTNTRTHILTHMPMHTRSQHYHIIVYIIRLLFEVSLSAQGRVAEKGWMKKILMQYAKTRRTNYHHMLVLENNWPNYSINY